MTIHFSGIHLSEESKKMIINECGALIQICEKEKIMINNVYATTEKIIEKITS